MKDEGATNKRERNKEATTNKEHENNMAKLKWGKKVVAKENYWLG